MTGPVLDRRAGTITVTGATVRLSPSETVLMSGLCRSPGQYVSREVLHGLLCEGRANGGPQLRCVDQLIWRIRRRAEQEGILDLIETRRGFGHRVTAATIAVNLTPAEFAAFQALAATATGTARAIVANAMARAA